MVHFLLFITFKLFVCLTYEADVDELGPVSVLCTFTAHIDDSVTEGSPCSAYYGYTASLEGFEFSVTCRYYFISNSREQSSSVNSHSWLDCFDYRYDSCVIARVSDNYIETCNMIVHTHQVVDCCLLIDGKNAICKAVLSTKNYILDLDVADLEFHLRTPFLLKYFNSDSDVR